MTCACSLKTAKDPLVFFGGKSYVPLFCELTRSFNCRKVVFYNSKNSSATRLAVS